MTQTFIELTEDEFHEQYPLLPNHLNPSAGWSIGTDDGCLFEIYGDELTFIKRQDLRCIWTLMDGDDGHMYVVSSFHHFNRVGYLLSRVPVPDDIVIQVRLPIGNAEHATSIQAYHAC